MSLGMYHIKIMPKLKGETEKISIRINRQGNKVSVCIVEG